MVEGSISLPQHNSRWFSPPGSLPSLIGPHPCPFQFPIPVPPPGITTSVPSSVPHPHSPLCASPRRGRGPQAGASVLRLFCTPQTFCIFLILLQHEILKVISVPAVCVLLFWLYWPEEGDKEGENWEEGHPLPAVPVALLRDKDIQQREARTFHKAPCWLDKASINQNLAAKGFRDYFQTLILQIRKTREIG